jgi:hypothetical protein
MYKNEKMEERSFPKASIKAITMIYQKNQEKIVIGVEGKICL